MSSIIGSVVGAVAAESNPLSMVLAILKNVSVLATNPTTLQWAHDMLVKSETAQAMLTAAVAAEKQEP